ncbi:hypothetical protein W02_35690 [Nitrospira sp. KM1]|uniref:hypothetical protein n=1 Tax=Nitrospira sp. KM1 TaxID=1936990 RepID=UPI0013A7695D|nr:hypothetical protein [Nitrospira sp. KM1]BCA56429.1 hypothetical protein W02_35690 [Nitrospira sp. KM1]
MHDNRSGNTDSVPQPLYVTLILDETGSMQSCKGAAIAGFNQYLAKLRQEPANTRVTLTLFNSGKTEIRYQGADPSAVSDLDVETYRPCDTTPLYDAIGRTLTAERPAAPAETKKLCVILTDGLENASKEYRHKQVFDMIKDFEQQGWTFLYLGADHDVWVAGESLGIAGDNTVSFCRRQVDGTFNRLSERIAAFRREPAGKKEPLPAEEQAPPVPNPPQGDGTSSTLS